MKVYKLINPSGSVYGIYNNKDMATKYANQAFMTYGFIPAMEIGEMPEVKVLHYNLLARGREWCFEANSIDELKTVAEKYAEFNNVDLNDCEGASIGFGYDADDNEVFIVEAL